MGSYTIGQVANQTGFSASALRYYEGIGLVRPPTRTASGYRMYDDQTLTRLAFIARAKQLGCSLEEITDLVSIWDREQCGPVQRRFHALVTDKIREARHQITELGAFCDDLRTAATQLSREPVDGPCGPDCACVTAETKSTGNAVPIALSTKPAEPPIACTLDVGAMPGRLDDWHAVLSHAISRRRVADGRLRIDFDSPVDVGELARLVTAEQQCCAFFSFSITVDGRGVALEVAAPAGTDEIVSGLFGAAE